MNMKHLNDFVYNIDDFFPHLCYFPQEFNLIAMETIFSCRFMDINQPEPRKSYILP